MSEPSAKAAAFSGGRMTLRAKIMGAVGLLFALTILLSSAVLFAHQIFSQRVQFKQQMEAISQVVADYCIAPVSFGDERGIEEAIGVLQSRPEIIAAELRNPSGTLLTRFGVETDENTFEVGESGESDFVGWHLGISHDLQLAGERIGVLYIVGDFEPLFDDMLARYLPTVLLLLAGSMVVMGPLFWIMTGALLAGLERLASSARQIADTGDYAVRAHVGGSDEVGQLTRTFNDMLDRLQATAEDLRSTNDALNHEIAERSRLEKELVESSRHAGMAEVATGVLHNVGNVLNSVNVSGQLVRERLENSRLSSLQRLAQMLEPHREDPAAFLTGNPKANALPNFICELQQQLERENLSVREEISTLNQNIEHIKEVVSAQQSLARNTGVLEILDAASLMEDASRIHLASIERHEVIIEKRFAADAQVTTDRHTILQILVNLVSNAIHAVSEIAHDLRRVELLIELHEDKIHFIVRDHGMGISSENLTRVFQHGFTTRRDGHGFGLHSGANAAKRLGGSLSAHSAGVNLGATFTLILPVEPQTSPKTATPSTEVPVTREPR